MTLPALAFAAGAALLQLQPALPSLGWAWLLCLLIPFSLRWNAARMALALGAGFFWAAHCAHQRMDEWLAPGLEGRDVAVVGVVSSLPAVFERGVRFELD